MAYDAPPAVHFQTILRIKTPISILVEENKKTIESGLRRRYHMLSLSRARSVPCGAWEVTSGEYDVNGIQLVTPRTGVSLCNRNQYIEVYNSES